MTIDFRAEVDKRKDAMMDDLFALLRINSERDDSQADSKHPFGPGPVKALEHFLAMAERDGYKIRNIDNYAGGFEFGEGDEVLGIFAHLDVVPRSEEHTSELQSRFDLVCRRLLGKRSADTCGV